ncbi:MAG: hypothetical protein J6A75_13260 [Lachnospiraceae bacterium]|nr:hypothetical protein [Lachnospiraceae bacterium]
MKLYEFILDIKNQKITKYEYTVKETEKVYTVQREEGKKGYIYYNSYTRVPKNILDNVMPYSCVSKYLFLITLSDNEMDTKLKFFNYICYTEIPGITKKIEELQKEKEALIGTYKIIDNMEVTNNEL